MLHLWLLQTPLLWLTAQWQLLLRQQAIRMVQPPWHLSQHLMQREQGQLRLQCKLLFRQLVTLKLLLQQQQQKERQGTAKLLLQQVPALHHKQQLKQQRHWL
jgi:hypothetical protein